MVKNVKIIGRDEKWITVQTTDGKDKYPAKSVLKIEEGPFDINGQTQMVLQDRRTPDEKMAPEIGYVHLGWGGTLDFNSSDDINELMDPFKMGQANVDGYLNLIAGFRNLVQLEIGNNSVKGINISYRTGYYFQGSKLYKIKMELKSSHWAVKINPLFFSTPSYIALFAMYGQGTSTYLDTNGDGFKNGKTKLYGVEFYYLSKYFSASLNLQWQRIIFNKFDIQTIGYFEKNIEMKRFLIGVTANIGLGI